MADLTKLVTWASEEYVTPQDDAIVYESAIGNGGVFYGCTTTIRDTSTLHIAAGHGVLCGRKFTIFAGDIPVQLSSTGDLMGRLYLSMDLSNTSAPIQLLVETGASLTPPIQQDNVNITNGVYEINMATFDVGTNAISNIANVFPTIGQGGSVSGMIAPEETSPTASAHYPGQGLIYEGNLYIVTDAIPSGGQLVPGTNIIPTTVMAAIYNMERGGVYQLRQSGWVLDSSTNLYEYALSLTRIISPTPEVYPSGSAVGVPATDAEEKAYGLLKGTATKADTSTNTMYFYAKSAPASDFYVLIKGVI